MWVTRAVAVLPRPAGSHEAEPGYAKTEGRPILRYRLWSARSIIVAPLLARVACVRRAPTPVGGGTSVPPTGVASSAVRRAAVGTAIDDYLAHGAVNLQNIRAVLVSQRGELLADRYYHSDAAAYAEIQSATKSVMSTLIGIALTKGDLESPDQTLGELLPQHRSAMSKSAARTTVRQLLTMTGGWTAFYDADTATPKLVRRVLMAGPGGRPGRIRLLQRWTAPALRSAGAGDRPVDACVRAA